MIEIKNRFNDSIYISEKNTLKEAIEEALSKKISFKGANLEDANLEDANLGCANLEDANLGCANLEDANLGCANLEGANLKGANLKNVKTLGCIISFSPEEYEQAKQFIEGLKKK